MNHNYIQIPENSDLVKQHELNIRDYDFFQCERCGLYKSSYRGVDSFSGEYQFVLYSSNYERKASDDVDEDLEPPCNEFLMQQIMK